MANVYDMLNEFYIKNSDAKIFFQKNIFERYLRKCAWKGNSEELLVLRFKLFSKMILCASEFDLDSIYDLLPEDYLEIFYELADFENKELNKESVLIYIKILEELFLEKEAKGFDGNIEEVELLRMFFYDEGKFRLLKRENPNSYKSKIRRKKISLKESEEIEKLKDVLSNKIFNYFSDIIFENDLKRAKFLFFYNNQFQQNSKNINKMFQNYFLNNYHLIRTDVTPIEFFYNRERENLDEISLEIIEEYLNAKWTLFFIKREDDDAFLCRDFFREREFFIPYTSKDFPEFKNMIFCANLEEGTMINPYDLNTIFVNENERKEIIKEINLAYNIYKYQDENPTFSNFFKRYSMIVHQIITDITKLFKTDVVPEPIDIEIIERKPYIFDEYKTSMANLNNMGEKLEFSEYSLKLLNKYYHDFLVKSNLKKEQNETYNLLLAILKNFQKLNGENKIDEDNEIIKNYMKTIADLLNSETFDPRYLTEEGFVRLMRYA